MADLEQPADLATELPQPTDGGLTYTFKLRCRASSGPRRWNAGGRLRDVAHAFQRINTAPLVAQYGFYYTGVIKGLDGKLATGDTKIRHRDPGRPDDRLPALSSRPATSVPADHDGGGADPRGGRRQEVAAGDYGRYVMSSGPYMIQGADKLDIPGAR